MKRDIVKETVKNLEAYEPEPQSAEAVLNANENPYDLPKDLKEEVVKAIEKIPFNRYPDPFSTDLIKAFSDQIGYEPERIIAGSGLDEILSILTNTFVGPGDTVVSHIPGFSMYQIWTEIAGGNFIGVKDKPGYQIDIEGLVGEAIRNQAKIIYICSPNNPTGYRISKNDLEELLESAPSLVVLDEAYIDFSDGSFIDMVRDYDNLMVLRTMSKAMRLPALRCGFAVGPKDLIKEMKKVKSPYNLNAVTQKAAEIVLKNKDKLTDKVEQIKSERGRLYDFFNGRKNLKVYPSQANFLFIETPDFEKLNKAFLDNGLLVRNYPDKKAFRITIGTPEENNKIIEAVGEVL